MDRIEKTILRNLLHDEKYMRQVYPFLRPEYFSAADQKIFKLTADFIEKYNNCPNREALDIALQASNLNENDFAQAQSLLKELTPAESNAEWLFTETEKFCKDKAVYNAILKSIEIIDGRDKKHTTEALPSMWVMITSSMLLNAMTSITE